MAADRALEVEFRPSGDPQIAVWLEDSNGHFVDTLMVTKLTGTFGLGNRPGRGDFGGAYLWPYGKREMVLPIWAHHRNVQYDRLVFQDCHESSLGWHEAHSSTEPFYCRPMTAGEMAVDTITCPTTNFNTDKGIPVRLIDTGNPECSALAALPRTSFYPPRNDISNVAPARDWTGISMYPTINDLDAITRATPAANQTYRVTYKMPGPMAPGDYVVWIEVNQEYDTNSFHHYDYYPDPQLRDYGIPSIGQPSVLWKIPISIGEGTTSAQAKDYAGYGSPDGTSGDVHAPDQTITTNMPGSGAGRLLVLSNTEGDYRVRVSYNPDAPCASPTSVGDLTMASSDYHSVDVGFVVSENVSMYEVRYQEGPDAIQSEDDFVNAVPGPSVMPADPGAQMTFHIDDLHQDTVYTVAVRSYDKCHQASEISTIQVHTPRRVFATVDACFIATAAYGSKDEPNVVELRKFRDRVLMKTELGQSLVDLYYAVSPPVADTIRDHDSLRFLVRMMLRPVVSAVRDIE